MKEAKSKEINEKKTAWDLQVRWKGALEDEERSRLRAWMQGQKNKGEVSAKIGSERSRLDLSFNEELLTKESREKMLSVKEMLEKEADAMACQDLEELANASAESLKGELLRQCRERLKKDWLIEAALALDGIIPPRGALSVKIAKDGQALNTFAPVASVA